MLTLPRLIHLADGAAEGMTPLNAFDNALLAAGVHNLNLVRVSSIVPRGAEFGALPDLPVGAVVATVYSHIVSAVPGEIVSACVCAGVGAEGGVLMEYQHRGPGDDAERVVTSMIDEAFARRRWDLERVLFATAEHKVDRLGCAVAAAVLLDGTATPAGGPAAPVEAEGR